MSNLKNISPIDGRYKDQTLELQNYFSEFALQKYRIKVEVEYFIFLCKNFLNVDTINIESLRDIYKKFYINDSIKIKEI